MHILVTSADGADGNGYGAILGFGPEGEFTGPFGSDPRIADPRLEDLGRGLTMGMVLSLPLIITGVGMLAWSYRRGVSP